MRYKNSTNTCYRPKLNSFDRDLCIPETYRKGKPIQASLVATDSSDIPVMVDLYISYKNINVVSVIKTILPKNRETLGQ